MNKKNRKRTKVFPIMALSISLGGFALFYLVPFLVSAVYAFVNNPIQMKFVGFDNFRKLFQNEFFVRGLKNTLIFMVLAIPPGMVCSVFLAMALKKLGKRGSLLSVFFLVPLVMPSAASVQFLSDIFGSQMESGAARWIMILLYIWKNLGYNTVLFLSGLYAIPEEYYSCAAVFGADRRQQFVHVTMVYLTPVSFLVLIMSFVNSFKIFREIYLLQGEYPHKDIYLLQHFVNNTMLSMSYHRLVSAVYVLTLMTALLVLVLFWLERRTSANLKL